MPTKATPKAATATKKKVVTTKKVTKKKMTKKVEKVMPAVEKTEVKKTATVAKVEKTPAKSEAAKAESSNNQGQQRHSEQRRHFKKNNHHNNKNNRNNKYSRGQNNRNHNFQNTSTAEEIMAEVDDGPALEKPIHEKIDIRELKKMAIKDLVALGEAYLINDPAAKRKQELIFSILKSQARAKGKIYTTGVVEVLQDGYGFLRSPDFSYLAGPDDIYVGPSLIRKNHLRTGDTISGFVRPPNPGERYFALLNIELVNNEDLEVSKKKVLFENLTPLYPDEKFTMENEPTDMTGRIIDLFSPIGKGQRGLIVAPPKAGKTVMLQKIAHSITTNHPEVELMVLLIDERPEEVTDMKRSVKGEVVSSTFDEPPQRHVHVAEMVIAKAKRLVEHKKDVVILLDSITRLGRAYNNVMPSSGKILSGGVDANALQKPKRFFGAARNVEHGGSLTIIATALVDTGSRMDEVIFEEFKGTGNMEIVLDRKLMEKRVFPAVDINKSGTRKEDLLIEKQTLQRLWILRKVLQPMSTMDSMQFVSDKLSKTKTNEEFVDSMGQ